MPRSDAISANLRPPPRFTTDMSSTMLLRGPRIVGRRRLIAVLRVPANNGDPGCRRIIADTAVRIGQVAADLCISIDPEVVVVGGKLAMAGEVFTQPFNEALQRLLFPDAVMPITVLSSPHPSDNCALGGALAAIGHAIRNSIAA